MSINVLKYVRQSPKTENKELFFLLPNVSLESVALLKNSLTQGQNGLEVIFAGYERGSCLKEEPRGPHYFLLRLP